MRLAAVWPAIGMISTAGVSITGASTTWVTALVCRSSNSAANSGMKRR